jgi:hypothetical protein
LGEYGRGTDIDHQMVKVLDRWTGSMFYDGCGITVEEQLTIKEPGKVDRQLVDGYLVSLQFAIVRRVNVG